MYSVIFVVDMDNECIPGKLHLANRLRANRNLVNVIILLVIKKILDGLLALLSMVIEPNQVLGLR